MPLGIGNISERMARLGEKLAGPPAVHTAALEGDLSRLRLLAQKQYDLDEADQRYGRTAMHIAAEKAYELIAGELLDRRAVSGPQDKAGRTPLLIASELGHLQVVQLLLGTRNRDPNRAAALSLQDARGYTPLLAVGLWRNPGPQLRASANGHAAVIRALLAAGASLGDTLEDRVSAGHLAARGGHLQALAALVNAGLNVRADTVHRSTLLHEAAEKGHAPVVEWLLARGVDPNVRSLDKQATALELAIVEGCHAAAMALRTVTAAPVAGPLAPPGAPTAPPLPEALAAGAAAVAGAWAGGGGGGYHPAGGVHYPLPPGAHYGAPSAYPPQPGPQYPPAGQGSFGVYGPG